MSEYLHTSYRPNRDYVDGIVAPGEMRGPDHAKVQGELLRYADQHSGFSVSESRIRIDLTAVFAAAEKDRAR